MSQRAYAIQWKRNGTWHSQSIYDSRQAAMTAWKQTEETSKREGYWHRGPAWRIATFNLATSRALKLEEPDEN